MKKIIIFLLILLLANFVNAQCNDTDGRDQYRKGSTFINDIEKIDYCMGDTLTEFFCEDSYSKSIKLECSQGCELKVNCSNGCFDGRCLFPHESNIPYKESYVGADALIFRLINKTEKEALFLTYRMGNIPALQFFENYEVEVIIANYSQYNENVNLNGNLKKIDQEYFVEIQEGYKLKNVWLSDNKIIQIKNNDKNNSIKEGAFNFLFKQLLDRYPSSIKENDFCKNPGKIESGKYCTNLFLYQKQKGTKITFKEIINWFKKIF